MANDTIINIPSDFNLHIFNHEVPAVEPAPAPGMPGPIAIGDIVRLKCSALPKMVVSHLFPEQDQASVWYLSELNDTITTKVVAISALIKIA